VSGAFPLHRPKRNIWALDGRSLWPKSDDAIWT
jgi:hypothetical protein